MNQPGEHLLYRLQRWYASNCDDDWEHTYGVTIDTLDNPGWMLTIDLVGTRLEGMSFVACGGALNLEEMISIFLRLLIDKGHSNTMPSRTNFVIALNRSHDLPRLVEQSLKCFSAQVEGWLVVGAKPSMTSMHSVCAKHWMEGGWPWQ